MTLVPVFPRHLDTIWFPDNQALFDAIWIIFFTSTAMSPINFIFARFSHNFCRFLLLSSRVTLKQIDLLEVDGVWTPLVVRPIVLVSVDGPAISNVEKSSLGKRELEYLVGCPTIRDWNRKLPQPANIWIAGTDLYFASIQPIGRTLENKEKSATYCKTTAQVWHRSHINSIVFYGHCTSFYRTHVTLRSTADMRSKRQKTFSLPPFHVKLYKYVSPVSY